MPTLAWPFPSLRPWSSGSPHFKSVEPTKHQAQRDFCGSADLNEHEETESGHGDGLPKLIKYNLLCDPPRCSISQSPGAHPFLVGEDTEHCSHMPAWGPL